MKSDGEDLNDGNRLKDIHPINDNNIEVMSARISVRNSSHSSSCSSCDEHILKQKKVAKAVFIQNELGLSKIGKRKDRVFDFQNNEDMDRFNSMLQPNMGSESSKSSGIDISKKKSELVANPNLQSRRRAVNIKDVKSLSNSNSSTFENQVANKHKRLKDFYQEYIRLN